MNKIPSLSALTLCVMLSCQPITTHAGSVSIFKKIAISMLVFMKLGHGTTLTTVDSAGDVGEFTSLQLDSAGHPVISYYDEINGDLKLAVCSTPTCSASNIMTIVDAPGNVGEFSSLQLNSAGNPVISYYDGTNGDLKLAVCKDPSCTANTTLTTIDSSDNVGKFTSLKLNSAGHPVISYYDVTNGYLKVAICQDPTCSVNNTITTVDTAGDVGEYNSLQLRSDGHPVISYYDTMNGDLKLVACGNPTCSASNVITTIDTNGRVGLYTSLQLDNNSNPVISYYRDITDDLKLVACGNSVCNTSNIITTIDAAEKVGQFTSLQLNSDGYPVISYYDTSNYDLKLAVCGDRTCSASNSLTAIDTGGRVGEHSSLQLDSNGVAVISYYDFLNKNLKLATRLINPTTPPTSQPNNIPTNMPNPSLSPTPSRSPTSTSSSSTTQLSTLPYRTGMIVNSTSVSPSEAPLSPPRLSPDKKKETILLILACVGFGVAIFLLCVICMHYFSKRYTIQRIEDAPGLQTRDAVRSFSASLSKDRPHKNIAMDNQDIKIVNGEITPSSDVEKNQAAIANGLIDTRKSTAVSKQGDINGYVDTIQFASQEVGPYVLTQVCATAGGNSPESERIYGDGGIELPPFHGSNEDREIDEINNNANDHQTRGFADKGAILSFMNTPGNV